MSTNKRTKKAMAMKLQFWNLISDCDPDENLNGLNQHSKCILLIVCRYFNTNATKFCIPQEASSNYWKKHRQPISDITFISQKSGFKRATTTKHLKELAAWGWIKFENISDEPDVYSYRISPVAELPHLDAQYVLNPYQQMTPPLSTDDTPPIIKSYPPLSTDDTPYIYKVFKTFKTLETFLKTGQTQNEKEGVVKHSSESHDRGNTPPPPNDDYFVLDEDMPVETMGSYDLQAFREGSDVTPEPAQPKQPVQTPQVNRTPQSTSPSTQDRRITLAQRLIGFIRKRWGYQHTKEDCMDFCEGLNGYMRLDLSDDEVYELLSMWILGRKDRTNFNPEKAIIWSLQEAKKTIPQGDGGVHPRAGRNSLGSRYVTSDNDADREALNNLSLEGE